jgi:hypothetical protein
MGRRKKRSDLSIALNKAPPKWSEAMKNPDPNQNYQRELAENLVKTCGIDGARDFARSNHWNGVIHEIEIVEGRFVIEGDEILLH